MSAVSKVVPIHQARPRTGLAAGDLFAGRYCLVQRLGRGGMGEVWLAADQNIRHRVVALKVLHRSLLLMPGYRERFEHESLALAMVEHPNVVTLYDWGTEPQPFIVMKRIEGVTLREVMREGQLSWVKGASFAAPVALGLSAMHRAKLWHRDVKPENVMVDEEGNVTLLDLGIARDAADPLRGETTDRIGSLGYLPPEMVLRRPTDHRGDLYQLGVMLYELIVGRKPYGGVDEERETDVQAAHAYRIPDPLRPQAPDCPEALEALVMRLLAKDPSLRYQSAREVFFDLSQVLRDHGSIPAGDPLKPLVDRALVQRKLARLAAAERESRLLLEVERAEQAQEVKHATQAQEAQTEAARMPSETTKLGPGFASMSPAYAGDTKPMGPGPRETIELGPSFVARSPASPAAQTVATAAAPAATAQAAGRALGPRVCGYYPAARVPIPAAISPVQAAMAVPVQTATVLRAGVSDVRAPFPLAKPAWWRRRRSAARVLALGVVAVLMLAAVVLTVRTLGVHIERVVPPASVATGSAQPPASAVPAPSVATPRPAATASAAAPPAVTLPAATAAPARSAAPGTNVTKKRASELVE